MLTINEKFELTAAENPNKTAVKIGEEEITYQDLSRKSDEVATFIVQYAKTKSIKHRFIAIYFERSIEMIITILGVLKAGFAYVPLDPASPEERNLFIVQDCNPLFVLGNKEDAFFKDLPYFSYKQIMKESSAYENFILPVVDVEQTAYIIYTSGTTGKPKGVLISHANVIRLFDNTDHWFSFSKIDIVPLFHSYAFDFSVWEIWSALLYGGLLIVIPHIIARDARKFWDTVKENKITVLNQTPSAFEMFIAEDKSRDEQLVDLRSVVFGGEKLQFHSLQDWIVKNPLSQTKLINMYGITETTVHVTYHEITQQEIETASESVIGDPIVDLQIYLLDEKLNLVPKEHVGEICIAGKGVSSGYLNRKDLTAEKFIENPFGPGKLYKSGDTGKITQDGRLIYIGRNDSQVKIHGFRIELGEIERVISSIKDVAFCHVLVKENDLIAYACPSNLNLDSLRTEAEAKLPYYMVPQFVLIDELPLNHSGKIDVKKLLTYDVDYYVKGEEPSTPNEKILSKAWKKVLSLSQIGVDNNFIELGGDSIKALQVLTECNKSHKTFSLQDLYTSSNLKELAQRMVPCKIAKQEDSAIMIDSQNDSFPLTRLQQGMLYECDKNPGKGIYYDVYSLCVDLSYDADVLRQAVDEITKSFEITRASLHAKDGCAPYAKVHEDVSLEVNNKDITSLKCQEKEILNYMDEERKTPWDISKPGLLRFMGHIRSPDSFQLTISFHHAILDGWSLSFLLKELITVYHAFLTKKAYFTKPEVFFFKDYVQKELEAIDSTEDRNFWQKQLSSVDYTPLSLENFVFSPDDLEELPLINQSQPSFAHSKSVNNPNNNHLESEDEVIHIVDLPLNKLQSKKLQVLAQNLKVPLSIVLLAVHFRVLSGVIGRRKITTGLVTNGRPEIDGGYGKIGLFLNVVPITFEFNLDSTWEEIITSLMSSYLQILKHRRFPLPEMQKMYKGNIFDTTFNFVDFHVYKTLPDEIKVNWGKTYYFESNEIPLISYFSLNEEGEIFLRVYGAANSTSSDSIMSVAALFLTTFNQICFSPEKKVFEESILPKKYLNTLESKQKQYRPVDMSISLFDLLTRSGKPEETAIKSGDKETTYGELIQSSSNLAYVLQSKGIKAGDTVVVVTSELESLVISMLACVSLSVVYCPIDVSVASEEMLNFVISDTDAKLLLLDSDLQSNFSSLKCSRLFFKDLFQKDCNKQADLPYKTVSDSDTAYIIYTSGTTGRSKGVQISYSNVISFISALKNELDITSQDKLSQFFSFSFDGSQFEILLTLASGATLIASREEQNNLIAKESTIVLITPSALSVLSPENHSTLRMIALGGEASNISLCNKWIAPGRKIYNAYGPTECTIAATLKLVKSNEQEVYLGTPLSNANIYLLDENMQYVPPGVSGEIYIGGPCVSLKGYLNLPEETQHSFTTLSTGEFVYRTKDIACYNKNGELIYVGRRDFQAKVRGFRIELEVIESQLKKYPEIENAAVEVENENIIAYICGEKLDTVSINEYMKKRLAVYAVPSIYKRLDKLPLTVQGKINRTALKNLVKTIDTNKNNSYEYAENIVEQLLAVIISETLGVDNIDLDRNLIENGLNSLNSFLIIGKLKQHGLDVTIQQLYASESIHKLSQSLEKKASVDKVVPLNGVTNEKELPIVMIHPAGGFIEPLFAFSRHMKNRKVWGIQFTSDCAQYKTTTELAQSYLKAIEEKIPDGKYIIAGHSFGGLIAYEIAQLIDSDKVPTLVLLDSTPTINEFYVFEGTLFLNGVGQFALNFGFSQDEIDQWKKTLESFSDEEKLQKLYHKIDKKMPLSIIKRFVNSYVLNMQLALNYEISPSKFNGTTLLIRQEQGMFNLDAEDYGIGKLMPKESLEVIKVKGGHMSMLQEPHVPNLVDKLEVALTTSNVLEPKINNSCVEIAV